MSRAGETMTVVLDTNVVVAALLWEGVPRRVLELAASDQRMTLVSSPDLLAELSRVLARPRFMQRINLTGRTVDELVLFYANLVVLVRPTTVARIVWADSDDDHVLALAVATQARLIVSGDRAHLLPIGKHEGIAIVTPRDALDALARGPGSGRQSPRD